MRENVGLSNQEYVSVMQGRLHGRSFHSVERIEIVSDKYDGWKCQGCIEEVSFEGTHFWRRNSENAWQFYTSILYVVTPLINVSARLIRSDYTD
mmetsp:Transcript_13679/g.29614  ORF Transcript_13679/g.29614 Transcript_13679/m.29614 type:complete len:94 (+) Transcript_13679:622-903(+)